MVHRLRALTAKEWGPEFKSQYPCKNWACLLFVAEISSLGEMLIISSPSYWGSDDKLRHDSIKFHPREPMSLLQNSGWGVLGRRVVGLKAVKQDGLQPAWIMTLPAYLEGTLSHSPSQSIGSSPSLRAQGQVQLSQNFMQQGRGVAGHVSQGRPSVSHPFTQQAQVWWLLQADTAELWKMVLVWLREWTCTTAATYLTTPALGTDTGGFGREGCWLPV